VKRSALSVEFTAVDRWQGILRTICCLRERGSSQMRFPIAKKWEKIARILRCYALTRESELRDIFRSPLSRGDRKDHGRLPQPNLAEAEIIAAIFVFAGGGGFDRWIFNSRMFPIQTQTSY
jgi:hypothetical protein